MCSWESTSLPDADVLRDGILRFQVGGSRYWPQRIDAGKHGQLTQALCDRAALFVKKRAHALAYQDDPTGVRSLLSTLVSPVGVGSSADSGSYDLLHICATFSTDPVITSFGLAFCQRDQGGHQHAAWEMPPADKNSGAFLWRLLSDGVMRETAHLLPMQLAIFYSFQVLSLHHSPLDRSFFPWSLCVSGSTVCDIASAGSGIWHVAAAATLTTQVPLPTTSHQ